MSFKGKQRAPARPYRVMALLEGALSDLRSQALSSALRQGAISLLLLALLLTACSGREAAPEMEPNASPAARPAAPGTATSDRPGRLTLVSPLESTQLRGGHDLRIAFSLVDHESRPVEGATVHVELWDPAGEHYASLICADSHNGRYLAEIVGLPLRGAGGRWQLAGEAVWKEGLHAQVTGALQVEPSISEMYQEQYGFWIEHPSIFGLGIGFYNLSESGGLHFEDWVEEDGGGMVMLDNYRYHAAGLTFATIEIRWQHAEYPPDAATALAQVQSLARIGMHHQDRDTPLAELTAEAAEFQGRPAWQVLGQGSETYVAKAAAAYPIEWLLFQCPGSDWLWSVVLATDREVHLEHLREVRETFECPAEPGS